MLSIAICTDGSVKFVAGESTQPPMGARQKPAIRNNLIYPNLNRHPRARKYRKYEYPMNRSFFFEEPVNRVTQPGISLQKQKRVTFALILCHSRMQASRK
jgi:hypothetical protein